MSEEPEKPQNSGDSGRDENGKFVAGHEKLGGAVAGSFSLVAMLKIELQKCPEGQDKVTYANMLIRRILKEAIENGDAQQIKNILQYVEGMPKQPIEMSGELAIDLIKRLSDVDKTENNGGDEISAPPESEGST